MDTTLSQSFLETYIPKRFRQCWQDLPQTDRVFIFPMLQDGRVRMPFDYTCIWVDCFALSCMELGRISNIICDFKRFCE